MDEDMDKTVYGVNLFRDQTRIRQIMFCNAHLTFILRAAT